MPVRLTPASSPRWFPRGLAPGAIDASEDFGGPWFPGDALSPTACQQGASWDWRPRRTRPGTGVGGCVTRVRVAATEPVLSSEGTRGTDQKEWGRGRQASGAGARRPWAPGSRRERGGCAVGRTGGNRGGPVGIGVS